MSEPITVETIDETSKDLIPSPPPPQEDQFEVISRELQDASVNFAKAVIGEVERFPRVTAAVDQLEELVLSNDFIRGLNPRDAIALYDIASNRKIRSLQFVQRMYLEGHRNQILARYLNGTRPPETHKESKKEQEPEALAEIKALIADTLLSKVNA